MSKKIGRNDPCPCGSGKKYKKCCGLNPSQGGMIQTPKPLLDLPERTGTLFDDYMDLFPVITIYGKRIIDFDEDGSELKKAVADFEKDFHPGEKNGILDSYFMNWMHYDLRFGKKHETITERFLSDPISAKLEEPGPTYIRHLNESYITFYEIVASSSMPDVTTVEELGTGQRFIVQDVRKLIEIDPMAGEIWFTRRVGLPDQSIFYTTPYIFDPDSRAEFKRVVKLQEKDFRDGPTASLFPADRHFAESQKKAAPFWAFYILKGKSSDFDKTHAPALFTTDGEELVFTEIHFRIRDEKALRKRLSTLQSFQYNDTDESWIWLKPKSRKFPDAPRKVIGHFHIKGDRLIAETSSQERASRLRSKLKGHLHNLIAYEKTLFRDLYDMPEMSPDEIEAHKKESAELNSIPEIQEEVKKNLEHHYFNIWPKAKIPLLGGLSPLQAVKRKKDLGKVTALIDDIEQKHNAPTNKMPNIDFDKLRRLLGLLPELTNFTPNAYRLWEALPPHTKTKILSNVWCSHCIKMTTIINYSGKVIQGDILLEGKCKKCGEKVARIIEKKDK